MAQSGCRIKTHPTLPDGFRNLTRLLLLSALILFLPISLYRQTA